MSRETVRVFAGTATQFLAWLQDWARTESMTRHPAGKKIGRG